MDIAKRQHHVQFGQPEVEVVSLVKTTAGRPIDIGCRFDDFHALETGLSKDILFDPVGAQRHIELAILGKHRRQHTGVPAATGYQFEHTHIVGHTEKLQCLQWAAIPVAVAVGLWA